MRTFNVTRTDRRQDNSCQVNPRQVLLLAVGWLLLSSPAFAQTLLWQEEFNSGSTLNPDIWSYELGDGSSIGIPGWGNNEYQLYTSDPANVRVEGGHLVITALDTGGTYTSARVKTQDKITIQYGTIEARIQLPDLGNGLWPAFWTLGNNWNNPTPWPHCGELDILEMGSAGAIAAGVVNRRVGSAAHWSNASGFYSFYGLDYTSPTNLNDSFHIYRMEWDPQYIRTYVDGNLIWEFLIDLGTAPPDFGGEEFHQPHFLILNMAVGGNYTGITGGAPITATLPAEYRVDWIRVYDNGDTLMGGSGYTLAVPPACLRRLP